MLLHSPDSQNQCREAHGRFLSQALPAAQVMGGSDVAITSCTSEASSVRPGDAFVAIDCDGGEHDAARLAVERGAIAIVCERFLPLFGVTQYVVDDSRAAYSQICHSLLDNPSVELNAIAIAGSYGKTSIAQVLESILLAAGKSVGCQTSQYTRIDHCPSRFVLPTTAPGVAEFIDESLAAGCRHAVVELSEEAIRRQVASAATFDVVCLSNLHGDQATGDRSPQDVRQSIASVLELLTPGGMTVLNADDQESMRLFAEYDEPVITFGLNHPADVSATVVERHLGEQTFILSINADAAAVTIPIMGDAHVQNCLAAAAIARVYGVSLRDIAKGIEQVKRISGVMHQFDAGQGVSLIFDRGQTPIAKGAALSAAREVTAGELIAVVDRPCSVTDSLADHTISTCEFSQDAVITHSVAQVLAALEVTDTMVLRQITEKLSGIAAAVIRANEGDIVVVCGLGERIPRRSQLAENIQVPYLVKDLLEELGNRLPTKNAA